MPTPQDEHSSFELLAVELLCADIFYVDEFLFGPMKITLLGTGTPTPSLRRMSSGYMVEIEDDVILLDHGPGSHHRLLESGKKSVDVSHVFFTHLHYDHTADYVRLMLNRWDQGGGIVPDLKVYGPVGTEHFSERLFGEDGAFALDIRARTELETSLSYYKTRGGVLPRPRPNPVVKEIKARETVETDRWRLSSAPVPHAQPILTCFAYRIDSNEGSVVYTGDSAPSSTLNRLAKDCDVLIHMCQRIDGTELSEEAKRFSSSHLDVARTAAASGAKSVVVSHVTDQMDAVGVKESLMREMVQHYDGNIIWGEDLMQIPVSGPTPRPLI